MNNNNVVSWVGNGVAVAMTAIQTNEVFQTISLILTIISIITTFAFTIYKWYKHAKEDGKITADEIKEIIAKGGETANQIIDVVNNYKDNKEKE